MMNTKCWVLIAVAVVALSTMRIKISTGGAGRDEVDKCTVLSVEFCDVRGSCIMPILSIDVDNDMTSHCFVWGVDGNSSKFCATSKIGQELYDKIGGVSEWSVHFHKNSYFFKGTECVVISTNSVRIITGGEWADFKSIVTSLMEDGIGEYQNIVYPILREVFEESATQGYRHDCHSKLPQ